MPIKSWVQGVEKAVWKSRRLDLADIDLRAIRFGKKGIPKN
jgi:hypothetical protein